MSDLLIKNLGMPKYRERLNLTILPDGSVIEHFYDTGVGKWHSYKSAGVNAEQVPPHGDLCDKKLIHDKMVENIHIANKEDFGSDKAKQNVTMAFKAVLYELENEIPTVLEAST